MVILGGLHTDIALRYTLGDCIGIIIIIIIINYVFI